MLSNMSEVKQQEKWSRDGNWHHLPESLPQKIPSSAFFPLYRARVDPFWLLLLESKKHKSTPYSRGRPLKDSKTAVVSPSSPLSGPFLLFTRLNTHTPFNHFSCGFISRALSPSDALWQNTVQSPVFLLCLERHRILHQRDRVSSSICDLWKQEIAHFPLKSTIRKPAAHVRWENSHVPSPPCGRREGGVETAVLWRHSLITGASTGHFQGGGSQEAVWAQGYLTLCLS